MHRRMVVMVSALLFLLLIAGVNHPSAGAQDGSTEYCAGDAGIEMLKRMNDLRKENRLHPLVLSEPLGITAEQKAHDMAKHDYVAHVSPDGQGPQELLDEVGYDYNTATGENIAAGHEAAEATFEQWLNSPEHREIMLDENYTAVGIGRAHNAEAKYDWYWVAEFGGEVGKQAEACDRATPVATPVVIKFMGS